MYCSRKRISKCADPKESIFGGRMHLQAINSWYRAPIFCVSGTEFFELELGWLKTNLEAHKRCCLVLLSVEAFAQASPWGGRTH